MYSLHSHYSGQECINDEKKTYAVDYILGRNVLLYCQIVEEKYVGASIIASFYCDFVISDVERQNMVADTLIKQCIAPNDLML